MPTVTTASAGSASSTSLAPSRTRDETGLTATFETFLQLLTTQLKSQDPLSPMDTEKFTSQLVQFSSVEQALKTNRQLEQLVSLTRTSAAAAGLAMVGRTVRVDGSRMLVDGSGGSTVYELDGPAKSVTVRVFDADGRLVHSAAGTNAAGPNRFDWDGKLLDGRRAEAGLYRIAVAAVDAGGAPVDVRLERTAVIEAVETGDSGLVLLADGIPLAAESVRAVPTTTG
jgi:flagellar basal-body rod modification protein FlgD